MQARRQQNLLRSSRQSTCRRGLHCAASHEDVCWGCEANKKPPLVLPLSCWCCGQLVEHSLQGPCSGHTRIVCSPLLARRGIAALIVQSWDVRSVAL